MGKMKDTSKRSKSKVQGRPLVSIVVPVFNAEKFLDECILSIVKQDIGFSKNIELILVDDGSEDLSGEICQKYEKQFPLNVRYVRQKNQGASVARNTGIKEARGEFIGFVDADDYLSTDAVGAVMQYFKKAPSDVNVAIIDVCNVGAKNLRRPISDKFALGTRTAGLARPGWYDVCPRVAPAFIRAEVAKRYRMSADVRYFEDTLFINEILMETMKLGIVAEGKYYYRRFSEVDKTASVTSGAVEDKSFYLDSPKLVSLALLEQSKKKFGEVPLYYQYLALYEMRWRTFYNTGRAKEVLDAREYKSYKKLDEKILKLVSDKAIMGFSMYQMWQKVYLLNMKYGKDILEEAKFDEKDRLVWKGFVLFNHWKDLAMNLVELYVVDKHLVVKGFFTGFFIPALEVYYRKNRKKCEDLELTPEAIDVTIFHLENQPHKHTAFTLRMPIEQKRTVVDFWFKINNHDYLVDNLGVSKMHSPDGGVPKTVVMGNYIVRRQSKKIIVEKKTALKMLRLRAGQKKRKLMGRKG